MLGELEEVYASAPVEWLACEGVGLSCSLVKLGCCIVTSPSLALVVTELKLGAHAARQLHAKGVESAAALFKLEDPELEALGLKFGPFIRLRACLRAIRAHSAKCFCQ